MQSLINSWTSSNSLIQQPSGVTTVPPAKILSKKPYHIRSSGPSDQPSGSPSIAVSVNPRPLPIIAPTTFTLDV